MTTDPEIVERCARAGFAVAAVVRRDELLLLRPASFADLPTAAALAVLAEELKTLTGARWVALDVDALAEVP